MRAPVTRPGVYLPHSHYLLFSLLLSLSLNLTIRLKIITSRLFLPTFGQRDGGGGGGARVAVCTDDRFSREIFYGLLAPGAAAEKGNVVAVI